jgi:hypothetical protein
MRILGRSRVSEFLGDRIVYRNLVPLDPDLPTFAAACRGAGLDEACRPRKTETDYAQVIVQYLQAARRRDLPGVSIRRLAFIGDTRMLDGTAYENLLAAGNWPGAAFIGSENGKPAAVELDRMPGGAALFLSNRWATLTDAGQNGFNAYCAGRGLTVDESMALVIDLDKTAIGARGRNGNVIDGARVQAAEVTVAALLGPAYNPASFREAYDLLNQPEFHPFTADNQDYLVYICLALGSGLMGLQEVISRVRNGGLRSFEQFITLVDARREELPGELGGIHAEIYANVQAGDPTPFKAFRRNEYGITVGRMGCRADGDPLEELLQHEIVITAEVREFALDWKAQGALVFGLSDKPDEASIPTAEQAAQGYQPIHRTETHVVGA